MDALKNMTFLRSRTENIYKNIDAAPDVSVCVRIHFSVFRMYKVVTVVLSEV